MKKWTEQDFMSNGIWYHATSEKFFKKIINEGILANVNRESELDFGYGFYLASNIQWSQKYAEGFEEARILVFNFRPVDILKGNSNYRFFGELDEEFAEFVFGNRMYYSECEDNCFHNYDIVAGVMSDGQQSTDFEEYRNKEISKEELFRRLLMPREDWQIAIHSQALCNMIVPSRAFDLKGGEHDVSGYHKAI